MIWALAIGLVISVGTFLLLLLFEGLKEKSYGGTLLLMWICSLINGVCWAIGVYGFVSLTS